MRNLMNFLAALLLFLALAAPAQASTVYTLDVISAADIGSGALGTVTLTQASANQVDVVVSLAAKTAFVSTGGPHNAFAYSLSADLTDYIVTVTSPLGLFTTAVDVKSTPYGLFTDALECEGCGPGASTANPGPLLFSVYAAGGISIADFVANKLGYFFAADVIGPNGGTGTIAATLPPAPVPLPAALPLFAGGLLGIGLLRRTKTRQAD